jgi:signal transduction histidine kinase
MVAAHSDSTAPERARRRGVGLRRPNVRGRRLALLLAWPPVLALGLLATVDAFGLGDNFAVAAWTSGLWLIAVTVVAGLLDQRAAEARTQAALERAIAAETVQRARADELSDVLRAGEGLVLLGEGKIDFMGILAAITPAGATSFLDQVVGSESVVVAAHGPLAPWFIGQRRPVQTDGSAPGWSLTSFSASGSMVGVSAPPVHVPGLDTEIQASLGVRLADHSGATLGWLHVLDPNGERILEPAFVNIAQLTANQIGVATENQALLAKVQHQLLDVQRMQQQLVQVAKLGAIGELAAAVAHEVNNPLTGILGFSELLLSELPADDPRHQEAAIIQTEAVRARTIIRSLLEFARPRPPQRIPTDLNELARTTIEIMRFRAHEAGIAIVEQYAELPGLEIDPDAFRQVMLNLLNNAIDAMPGGGELRLTTRRVDDRVGFVVADNGVGMDARTRSRIFAPFFSTRAGAAGGTGLGLSVSLQIVESHGGSIDVETEQGKGSVFTVWLPVSWAAFDGAVIIPGQQGVRRDGSDDASGVDPAPVGASSEPGSRSPDGSRRGAAA